MAFAARLDELMKLRGVSKSDVAAAIGITPQGVGQWFRAEDPTTPGDERKAKIAKFLQVTTVDLAAPVGTSLGLLDAHARAQSSAEGALSLSPPEPPPKPPIPTPDMAELFKAFVEAFIRNMKGPSDAQTPYSLYQDEAALIDFWRKLGFGQKMFVISRMGPEEAGLRKLE